MSECPFHDITNMRDFMSEINSNDNIKMGDGKFWMPFEWHYSIGTWYMSECSSYDIKVRGDVCLIALYMIWIKWEMV